MADSGDFFSGETLESLLSYLYEDPFEDEFEQETNEVYKYHENFIF